MDKVSDRAVVAVIGGGLIGISWSALCLAHGHEVRIWEPDPQQRARIAEAVQGPLAQLKALGNEGPLGGFTISESLEDCLTGAQIVQENAPESVPVKHALYREIEALIGPEALIASSTSSLVWSVLSTGMVHPARLITAHPFNPPHLMPLVELYGPDATVLERAEAFYRGLGRVTVRLRREAVGHIANRLSSALWREAVHIVAEGIADVEEVDKALVAGPGLRWSVMGAHLAYHLGGGSGGMAHYLAHLGPSQERRWESLGAPRLTPELCAALIAGVEREAAGRSIAELEAERDAALLAALRLRGREGRSLD